MIVQQRKRFLTITLMSLSFPPNDVDAVVGFFESRGFEKLQVLTQRQ